MPDGDMIQLTLMPEYFVMCTCHGTGGGRHYTPDFMDAVKFANAWVNETPYRRKEPAYTAIVYMKAPPELEPFRRKLRAEGIDTFFGIPLWETLHNRPEEAILV